VMLELWPAERKCRPLAKATTDTMYRYLSLVA